ncbi:MAG: hypothetical protein AB8B91_25015 [Rubripirellula sp.]
MARVEVLRAACCIAGVDGKVDEQERELIQKLSDDVGVGKASLEAMILRAETEPDFYEVQFRVLKTDARSTMAILTEIATQDGRLEPKELEVLQHFAGRLGLDRDGFREVAAPFIGGLNAE